MPKKTPHQIDKHVGSRVRMRRLVLDMSQGDLGDAIGLTFQQVQKYEKGTNRIGASRLQQIATTLQVPVAYFFEGLPGAASRPANAGDIVEKFFTLPYAVELAGHYVGMAHNADRRAVTDMAHALARRPAPIPQAAE